MARLDFLIFGATGFTGKEAVVETARIAKKYGGFTWGIAGRSHAKLEDLKTKLSKKIDEDLSNMKVIVADVNNEQSLKEMCQQTKVLINCCGPYRFYGENVVRAAIDNKTHYVDVTGEPQFMETMQLQYDGAARDAGVYIVSACGFDSIPNDMGVIFLEKHFDGVLNSVESYVSTHIPAEYQAEAYRSGVIHYGTWESLIYGITARNELKPLRQKLYPERLPTFKPKLQSRSVIHKYAGKYCLPFPGADASVVYRTQRYMYEKEKKRPIQFKPYVKFATLTSTIMTIAAGIMLLAMTLTEFTKKLLLNYPRIFSFGFVTHDGPKEVVMNNTFFEVELIGEGWERGTDIESTKPNKKVVAKVKGANIGYGATVTALAISAFTVLTQSDRMPSTGGVMTPGMAFYNTDLIAKLNENNLTFEIVDPK